MDSQRRQQLSNLSSPLILASLSFFVLVSFVLLRWFNSTKVPKGYRLLPGPKGWPIIGNSLQLNPWPAPQLRQWAAEHGDVYRLNLAGRDWAMVCSPEAIKDIMVTQSVSTSGRPPMPVMTDFVSGDLRLLLMQYTTKWRTVRAIVHKLLTPKVSDTFRPSQEFEAKQLVNDILTDNEGYEKFYKHVRRYTTSIVMTSTYGKRIASWESKHVQEVYQIMADLSALTVPGAFLADMIPALNKLPVWLQLWRGRAYKYHESQARIWLGLWRELQDDIARGQAPECFVKGVSDDSVEKLGISEKQAAFVAGTLIEAGSETTGSAINSALKLLAAYPQTQVVANEILTKVCGEERSPTFKDEPNLQYIRAIVKETMRLCPTASLGAAHLATEDITYKDFFIPKGTIVSLAMNVVQCDSRYEAPLEFRPERFMSYTLRAGAYAAMRDPAQRDHFGFGIGRRICPGMHLAENSQFITIAKILWAFELRPVIGEDGKEETLDIRDEAWEPGAIVVPKPFKLRFIPRSKQREAVIRKEWEDAQRDGYWWGDVKVNKNGMICDSN